MADTTDKTPNSAEKAYADAAAEVKPAKAVPAQAQPVETPVVAVAPAQEAPVEMKQAAVPNKPAAKKIEKPARKPATKIAIAKAAKRAARVAKAAAAPAPVKTVEPKLTVSELKEKIMATAQKSFGTNDFAKPIAEAFGEYQTKAKAAYEKSTEVATEVTEFAKGNVEALVESGKIFAAGAQTLGKGYVEEAKSAYETMTADVKELAAVKSPTELFQLQGKIARRNFDMFVATSSKNTEAFIKLANDAFAPLTGRVEVATEKLAKVA